MSYRKELILLLLLLPLLSNRVIHMYRRLRTMGQLPLMGSVAVSVNAVSACFGFTLVCVSPYSTTAKGHR